jgi:predicted HTH domain antitoxin
MQVKIALEAKWGNLEDKLLEMIVVQSDCEGSISVGKVGELLGMKTRLEIDAFLQNKGINLPYGEAKLECDRQTHEQLRQEQQLKNL